MIPIGHSYPKITIIFICLHLSDMFSDWLKTFLLQLQIPRFKVQSIKERRISVEELLLFEICRLFSSPTRLGKSGGKFQTEEVFQLKCIVHKLTAL